MESESGEGWISGNGRANRHDGGRRVVGRGDAGDRAGAYDVA